MADLHPIESSYDLINSGLELWSVKSRSGSLAPGFSSGIRYEVDGAFGGINGVDII